MASHLRSVADGRSINRVVVILAMDDEVHITVERSSSDVGLIFAISPMSAVRDHAGLLSTGGRQQPSG